MVESKGSRTNGEGEILLRLFCFLLEGFAMCFERRQIYLETRSCDSGQT